MTASAAATAAPPGKRYAHLRSRVFNTPLAITKAKFDDVLAVLGPRLVGVDFPVSAQSITGNPTYREPEMRGAVAIIPVCGILIHRALGVPDDELDAMSGLTSYRSIRAQLDAALNDNSVGSILLDIDSHGGEVNGLFDLTDHIFEMRGRKPIVAVADESAYSAAYAIFAAAGQRYVSASAGVGSIGVIVEHLDESKLHKQLGLKFTTYFRGARKNDFTPNQAPSAEAEAWLNEHLDDAYGQFVEAVSRYVGLDDDDVRGTEAGVFFGEKAIEAGLADELSTVEAVLASLASRAAVPAQRGRLAAVATPGGTMARSTPKNPKAEAQPKPADPSPDPKPTPAADPAVSDEAKDEPETEDDPQGAAADQPAEPVSAHVKDGKVVDLDGFRREQRDVGATAERVRAKALTDHCVQLAATVGRPELAAKIAASVIDTDLSLEAAQERAKAGLFDAMAADSGPEVKNQVSPLGAGASSVEQMLRADAKKRGDAWRKQEEQRGARR